MSSLFGSNANNANANQTNSSTIGDLSQDRALNSPPDDSISDIAFSPVADHLAVASWDKKVRIYQVEGNGDSEGRAFFEHDLPVLSCHWSPDGTKVVGGGADRAARMLDLGSGNTTAQQVGLHEQPIRSVRFFTAPNSNAPMVATGSWDKTIKYWDLRSSTPAGSVTMQDRVYSMDVKDNLLVVGCAEKFINVIDLNSPGTIFKQCQSPLKWQTRVVSCFADAAGYAVGSIEGRSSFQWLDPKQEANNFSFKCHRGPPEGNVTKVYSVNAISFHPTHGTFSTAGSDGTYHFWDKDAKHRLKGYPAVGGTISATDFNRQGTIFAYAVSYDWSQGYSANTPQYPNKIMLHPVVGDECKPRPPQANKKR